MVGPVAVWTLYNRGAFQGKITPCFAPCASKEPKPEKDTLGKENGRKAPCKRCGRIAKIGGICRPILLAGIRAGVAMLPRLGSHRTAEPTVKGLFTLSQSGSQ